MGRTLLPCLLALVACMVLPERTLAQQMTELIAKEKAKAAIVLPFQTPPATKCWHPARSPITSGGCRAPRCPC